MPRSHANTWHKCRSTVDRWVIEHSPGHWSPRSHSLHATVCVCLWWTIKVCTDPQPGVQCQEPSCLSFKALQAQSKDWPQIICRAPATSALHRRHCAHLLTGSRRDRPGAGQGSAPCSSSAATAGNGWRWQKHSFMLFPSFEIAIKADLIKQVCIIEVFGETLTGSRYSVFLCKRLTRSRGNSGIRGVMTETLVRDVNQTSAACVSWCCMSAYRKQSCICQSSVDTHLKQSCICHCPGLLLFV